jgi:DNA-binding NtrC family response regulator
VLASGDILRKTDLPPEIQKKPTSLVDTSSIDDSLPFREWKKRMVEAAEREYFIRKLEENDHNVTRTARSLDMLRQSLQQKLRELGIDVRELQE